MNMRDDYYADQWFLAVDRYSSPNLLPHLQLQDVMDAYKAGLLTTVQVGALRHVLAQLNVDCKLYIDTLKSVS